MRKAAIATQAPRSATMRGDSQLTRYSSVTATSKHAIEVHIGCAAPPVCASRRATRPGPGRQRDKPLWRQPRQREITVVIAHSDALSRTDHNQCTPRLGRRDARLLRAGHHRFACAVAVGGGPALVEFDLDAARIAALSSDSADATDAAAALATPSPRPPGHGCSAKGLASVSLRATAKPSVLI